MRGQLQPDPLNDNGDSHNAEVTATTFSNPGKLPLLSVVLGLGPLRRLRNLLHIHNHNPSQEAGGGEDDDVALCLTEERKADLARKEAEEKARKVNEFRKYLEAWKEERYYRKSIPTVNDVLKDISDLIEKEGSVEKRDGEEPAEWVQRVRRINGHIRDMWHDRLEGIQGIMLEPMVWPHWEQVMSGLGGCLGCYATKMRCDREVVRRGFLKSGDEQCGRCLRRGAACVVSRGTPQDGQWEFVQIPAWMVELDPEERQREKSQIVEELLSKARGHHVVDAGPWLVDGVDKAAWAPRVRSVHDQVRLKHGSKMLRDSSHGHDEDGALPLKALEGERET